MTVLGAHCCFGLFSSCSEWWLVSSAGMPLQWLLLLQSPGPGAPGPQKLQHMRSVVVAPRLSCSAPRGIFLDKGSNPYLLHWQMNSLPLNHQGRLDVYILRKSFHILRKTFLDCKIGRKLGGDLCTRPKG